LRLAVTRGGRLWLQTDLGLYAYLAGGWTLRSPARQVESRGSVGSMSMGPDGRLWTLASNDLTAKWSLRRWAGGRWSQVPIPHLRKPFLYLVASRAGSYLIGAEDWLDGSLPLVLRRTAGSWTRLPPPAFVPHDDFKSLAANAPSDLWASVHINGTNNEVLAHWNGQGWKQVAPPSHPVPGAEYAGELTMAGDDLWVSRGSVVRYGCQQR
jgi:hypothetical protein